MNLKEKYHQFRTWQKEPRRYSDKAMGNHHCANCDHDFTGNYCPVCGQEATWGRISWASVRDNVMILWGMDSHSMPYSIFQLMLRPGYFISDYLSGRRQVSYPPVKMLFVLAIIFAIVRQLIGTHEEPIKQQEGMELIISVVNWMKNNPGWGMMTITLLFTIPTWITFRFSPRHAHHTFPESVFIQLFMSTLMLICSFLEMLWTPLFLLIPFYYYITYRQFFGYSRWGTLWRLAISFLVWLITILFATLMTFLFTSEEAFNEIDDSKAMVSFILMFIIPIVVLLTISYWIGKRTEKKRNMAK